MSLFSYSLLDFIIVQSNKVEKMLVEIHNILFMCENCWAKNRKQ